MRLRSTLVLLLVLIGLGAYVYWVEMPKAEQEAKKKTLVDFKADDATALRLVYADREISLKKDGNEWRITKPIDAPADDMTVKNLLNAIAECEVKKTLDDVTPAAGQYGLDPPFAKVTVTLKDGHDLPSIIVGKTTPVGYSTYVQKSDDAKIVLTSSSFHAGVDKKVKDLRDKVIVNLPDTEVQKIEIVGTGKDIVLNRKDDAWTMAQPGPYAADGTMVRSFLSTIHSMRAIDFADDQPANPGTYGLDAPQLTVKLFSGKDNAETDLRIGKPNDNKQLYVQTSGRPTVYLVSDWVLRDLDKNPGDLRDKTVLAFDRDAVTAVDVTRQDGGHFKLVRGADKQWTVDGHGTKPLDTAINQYVGDLHDLKGYEVAADQPSDLTPFGLDHPLLTITITADKPEPIGTMLLGTRQSADATKKEYTGMSQGGTTVYLIRDYLVTRLDKHAEDFLPKPTPTIGTPAPGTPTVAAGAELEDEPADDDGGVDEPPGAEQE